MSSKVLISGLGGGLDVVNAALLFFLGKAEGKSLVSLGSARPAPRTAVSNVLRTFSSNGSILNCSSKIDRPRTSRYAEPLVSGYLNNEPIYYIARLTEPTADSSDTQPFYSQSNLRKTIDSCCTSQFYRPTLSSPTLLTHLNNPVDELGFDKVVFVDGGGDSLIVRVSDSPTNEDPFKGGDAEMLRAIRGRTGVVQGIVSVGLDIKEDSFFQTIDKLKQRGGYYGAVNLATGEKKDYSLSSLFSFETFGQKSVWMQEYFNLCEKVLVLNEEDLQDEKKMMSHTAVVTYWALKQQYGVKRTFVQWEPTQPDGTRGVLVKPEHCWMYFVDPTTLEDLKMEIHSAM